MLSFLSRFHRLPHLLFYPLLSVGTYVSQTIFVVSFFAWIIITCGWFQRFVIWWIERELRRVLNDTPVTLGGIEIHWWHGQVDLYNLVIHTPRRDEWQWQSPLIGRVGKLSVQASIAGWAYSFVQYGPRHVRLEIYTVRAEDVQVFVERQQHIFNFYLCDPMLELPDPSQVITATNTTRTTIPTTAPLVVDATEVLPSTTEESSPEDVTTSLTLGTIPSASTASPVVLIDGVAETIAADTENEAQQQQQAQQLVNDMVMAVQSLGEAAQRGKMTTALHRHRQTFASKLKQLTQQENSVFFRKSVQVMQQVSHAVVQNNKRGRVLLPFTPPAHREDRPRTPPIQGRVGRVVVRDVRVFTRATTSTPTTSANTKHTSNEKGVKEDVSQEHGTGGEDAANHDEEQQRYFVPNADDPDETIEVIDEESIPSRPTKHQTATSTTSQTTCWNKPLYIQQVVLRASELCPPKSLVEHNVVWGLNDTDDIDYPAIYQPLDKVAQVVLKRLLAEMAKSNTGRLLETAMGEVLAYLQVTQSTSTTTPSAASNKAGAGADPTITTSTAIAPVTAST